ncbi:RNA-directed DNA polymerase, eukaryota, partial [Tanacetum coccineum]
MVLDESCLNNEEFSLCLLGKVTEFASLTNLKVVLAKEGFGNIKLKYMGGFWVMIVFQEEKTMKAFHGNKSVGSWFSQIGQAHKEFVIEERVIWVEIEGVPCKWWSKNTFTRIASRWGNLLNAEDLEEGGYHSIRLCIRTKINMAVVESFKMVYRGKTCWVRAIEVPGWVPDFEDDCDDDDFESNDGTQVDEGPGESVGKCSDLEGESDSEAIPETRFEDEHMDKFDDINYIPHSKPQSEDPFGVYELLNKKKKVTNNEGDSQNSPTYPPGFTPNDNAEDNINISNVEPVERGHNGDKEEGEFVVSQNQDRIDTDIDANESTCSGHFKKSTGPRTGGSIIQLIEDLVNVGQTMGYDMTGCMKNMENIIESQGVAGETKLENIDLWCIQRCWGNFNFDYVYSEAVGQSGGILSVWDPNKFQKLNHTISDYCTLVRGVWVPNGRKLLIISIYAPQELSEKRTLWDYLCFTICNWNGDVVTMGDFNEVRDSSERFGSVFNKHGAKLFNDIIAKAGLTEVPLGGCIFTWCHKTASKMSKLDRFLIDGFDKLVEDSWNEIHVVDNNAYVRFMKKLKLLKERIKAWNSSYRELKNYRKNTLKTELTNLDSVLDRGEGIDMDVTRRSDDVRILQDIEKTEAMEVAQKDKIKWAVEGDENSKYYHGAIDLEREVSKEEVKRAVWDCGIDKAPGPDGFTFGFYRRFWNLIECDVVNVVKWFFLHERIPSGGNSSFITLIPKASNANIVKDFRPISLIGSVYKIVAKILANRLVLVLPLMESLHLSFQRVVDAGLFSGIKLDSSMSVSHLFYADDAIFMRQWNQSNIDTIVRVLKVFHSASDLRINMKKSKLMGIAVDASRVEQAIRQIGCMALKMPFKYLGSVVRDRMSRVKAWNDVIDTLIGKTVKPIFPSIWLNIIQEVAVMKLKGIDVVSFVKPKCGDGTNISFWNDAWRGDVAFKILAPRIYMLESMKDIQVATKLSHVDLEWSFRRKSRGGAEQIQMTTLKEILEGCILSDTKDTWTWSLEGSGEFSVSSIRKTIDAAFLPCGNVKTRWVKEVPIKINILAWKVSNDYLPTRFNLSRRGMDIGSIVCPMCNSMVESSRHLFFSCDLSNQIMSKISRWMDFGNQEINSYEEWIEWMLSIRLPYNLKKVFEGVCYIVWWFIWDWRNQAIFGPGFRAKSMMFDDIVS